METAIALVLALVIGVLLVSLLSKGRSAQAGHSSSSKNTADKSKIRKTCTLCFTALMPGQTLKTKVTDLPVKSGNQMGVKESIATVYGCAWCWPANHEHPRVCPACKSQLGLQDYVIARYFERSDKRNHLRILGCTRCRNPNSLKSLPISSLF